jgi:4-amino-4-deoxy-L-arabinose transferase-like glycosyltransferase
VDDRQRAPWYRDPAAWSVAGLAVVVRLAWVAFGMRTPRALADPAIYLYSALQVACGRGYVALSGAPCAVTDTPHSTSYYPPGYPLYLGVQQWVLKQVGLGSHTLGVTGVVQSLMGGVAVLAVFVVGRRLGGRAVGLAAAVVLAFWPNLVVYSGLLLSETLFITAFAVSLAAVLTMNDQARWHWGRAVLAGASFGLACMVRPQVLLTLPALALAWAVCRTGWRQVLARSAVLGVGVLVVAAPWAVRNHAVFGAFVPFSTNGGDNLCVGFHPGANGRFAIPEYCDTGEFYTDSAAAELRRDKETRKRAINWIRSNPGELPALSAKKLWATYRTDADGLYAAVSFGSDQFLGSSYRTAQHVVDVVWGVLLAAALLGLGLTMVRGWGRRRVDPTAVCIVLATLAGAVVPVLFFGDPRFKLGLAPLVAVLAGVTLTVGRRWPEPVEHLAPEPDAADVLEEVALTGQLPVVVAQQAGPDAYFTAPSSAASTAPSTDDQGGEQ